MVKSKETARARMERGVRGAGEALKEGFREGENPVKVLLADPDLEKKHQAGVAEAHRKGKMRAGLKKADERNAWPESADRAAAHYTEKEAEMVDHAMEDYDQRATCLEAAKKAVKDMPRTTVDQREARGKAYRDSFRKCLDKAKGRTT
jgi:hypothetical protein